MDRGGRIVWIRPSPAAVVVLAGRPLSFQGRGVSDVQSRPVKQGPCHGEKARDSTAFDPGRILGRAARCRSRDRLSFAAVHARSVVQVVHDRRSRERARARADRACRAASPSRVPPSTAASRASAALRSRTSGVSRFSVQVLRRSVFRPFGSTASLGHAAWHVCCTSSCGRGALVASAR